MSYYTIIEENLRDRLYHNKPRLRVYFTPRLRGIEVLIKAELIQGYVFYPFGEYKRTNKAKVFSPFEVEEAKDYANLWVAEAKKEINEFRREHEKRLKLVIPEKEIF